LQHVYSAQHFDDHAAYSRQLSPEDSQPVADSESLYSESSSHQDGEKLKEKGNEDEAAAAKDEEVELEDIPGIMSERDVEKSPPLDPLGSGEEKKDPYLVTWTGPDDPFNPKNWKMSRKWAATFVVSAFTFISPVSSSMVAPAMKVMSQDLAITTQLESAMVLSIFVLAYAVGPLFLGPLSEVYGRVIILQLSNMWYLVWNLACGFAQTGPQMMVFRFMAGLGGSAPLAIGGAVLGDCFTAEQRGKAISIYTLAPLLGPAVGPIAGGFISQSTTWRWVFWATTILDGVIQVFGFFFLQGMLSRKRDVVIMD
jgi:multidrug resistance protein